MNRSRRHSPSPYDVISDLERRVSDLEKGNGSLERPSLGYGMVNVSTFASTTSATFETLYALRFPVGVAATQLRTYFRCVSPSGSSGEVRIGWETSGSYTSAFSLTDPYDDYVEFKWRHTQISVDTLVIQARLLLGAGPIDVYAPHPILIAMSIDGATTTGL